MEKSTMAQKKDQAQEQQGSGKPPPQQKGAHPAQAIDWNKLLQLAQTLGEVAPIAYQAFMAILDRLREPSPVMGAAGGGMRKCPDQHLCDCHDELIGSLADALALAVHCKCCCQPDSEG
jgi:hypothetical protein